MTLSTSTVRAARSPRRTPAPTPSLAGDLVLFVDRGDGGPDVGMSCELADEGDTTIDAFEAVAATTSTPTPTARPWPRPSRQPRCARSSCRPTSPASDHASALPLVLGGGLLAAGTGALVASRARVRAGSRRH